MNLKDFLKPTKMKVIIFAFFLVFSLSVPFWSVSSEYPLGNFFHLALFYLLMFGSVLLTTLSVFINSEISIQPIFMAIAMFVNIVYLYILSSLVMLVQNKTKERMKVPFSLVFIAILIVLFLVGPFVNLGPINDGGLITCHSESPQNIMVKASQVNSIFSSEAQQPIATFILVNLTSQTLSNISCRGNGAFSENIPGCPTETWDSMSEIELTPYPKQPGNYIQNQIELQYTSEQKTETTTLTCSGTINIT